MLHLLSKKKEQKQGKYQNIFLESSLQPAGLKSLLPAPMKFLCPCAQLTYFQVLNRNCYCTARVSRLSALLGLLQIFQIRSFFMDSLNQSGFTKIYLEVG